MKSANTKKLGAIVSEMEGVMARLDEILSEEQEAFDNKSEKWQESEAGDTAQTQLGELESAIGNLDSAKSDLENIVAASA